MTIQRIFELVRKKFPHIGHTELLQHLNDAIDDFWSEVGNHEKVIEPGSTANPENGIAIDAKVDIIRNVYVSSTATGHERISRLAGDKTKLL